MNFEEIERREAKIIYYALLAMFAIGILILTCANLQKGDKGSSDDLMQFCESEVCDL